LTGLALVLVLGSAVAHATWNLLAKTVGGGAPFVWLFQVVGVAAFAPAVVVALALHRPERPGALLGLAAGSACLHGAYFVILARGYRAGDLSLVYPLARGTGPLLSVLGAIALLGERPGPAAIAGTLLICGGVLALLGGGALRAGRRGRRRAACYALATGLLIACYTVWDGHAVRGAGVSPLVYLWLAAGVQALLLAPAARRGRAAVVRAWRDHRRATIAVGLLQMLAYVLVLAALQSSPVSYVAPVREVSILFGTLLGIRFLGEGDLRRRLPAAAAIVAGVFALAFG
jgi:drug/metabolite transporter (DMT)-like permease